MTQASSCAARGKSGFLSTRTRGIGPHLEMRWVTQGSSQVVTGNTCFLWSWDRYLKESHEYHKASEASFQFSRGNSGLLSRCCRGKFPHLALRGESYGFSRVSAGSLGFLWSCNWDLMEPLVFHQGHQDSFRVARGSAGWLSSQCRGIGPHLILRG